MIVMMPAAITVFVVQTKKVDVNKNSFSDKNLVLMPA